MWVINVTFFSTTFYFSFFLDKKKKFQKITFWVRNPEKISILGRKNEKISTQGVKTYKTKKKFRPCQLMGGCFSKNLIKP